MKCKLGCDYKADKKKIAKKYIDPLYILPNVLSDIIVDYFYEEWYTVYDINNHKYKKTNNIIKLNNDTEIKYSNENKIHNYIILGSEYYNPKDNKFYEYNGRYRIRDYYDNGFIFISKEFIYILPCKYPISNLGLTIDNMLSKLVDRELEKLKAKKEREEKQERERQERMEQQKIWCANNPPKVISTWFIPLSELKINHNFK